MYKRYDEASKKLPVQFVERNESYYKRAVQKRNRRYHGYLICDPAEGTSCSGRYDCLVCDIKSSQGYEYAESSWKPPTAQQTKLLKSIVIRIVYGLARTVTCRPSVLT